MVWQDILKFAVIMCFLWSIGVVGLMIWDVEVEMAEESRARGERP